MAEGSYPVLVYDPNAVAPTFAGSTTHDNAIYTLSGIRLSNSATKADLQRLPKGIYIIGGKKVVNK